MGDIKNNKCIWHLTALSNLESIIQYGLLSRASLEQKNLCSFEDIADPEIIQKRKELGLHDCVPFHFVRILILM
ncbi:DarT ssDNA thymidine ADP-ribosyltransferase family protein [Veillonella agrestimuris]|uniref:DarT ssDNA thymidine ADP-ribosyltransferase family protein n=1 Tax=Veillonella agrestimuris TaxID=2941340 RepID=UPI00203C1F60|nr:DarT ssDNA thymidine ADP-ribosyltransferase family protein [Veillonella agrestimuris]